MKHGDIFDLAKRNGASDLKTAYRDVAAYAWGRKPAQKAVETQAPSQGLRRRYDILREDQAEAIAKSEPEKEKPQERKLTFVKDRGKSVEKTQEQSNDKDSGGKTLRFVKDKGRDDDRSR
jgi:hypothetical protein